MVGAACGSDRDDDDGAQERTTTTEASGGEVTFGDLASPCGGEGQGNTAGEQGVTADSITIGYGDDAGFTGSPGLNREMSHAVEALIEWCNEQGGINGRRIVGKYYDAKITDVNNVMMQACDEVFMLVGQGWALDSAQEETRVGCDLPSVPTYSVSPAFAHGPKMIQAVPNPVDYQQAHSADALAKLFPDAVEKAATLAANYAATLDTRAKIKSAHERFGWEWLNCDVEYNIAGESDWRPLAQRLKDCGAELVNYTGTAFPNFTNFLEAADQVGFEPIYSVDGNLYEEALEEWSANGLANKVYFRFSYVPFAERDEVKAVDDYLTLIEESGGDVALLGMQATSSTLLWMTGVSACGAELSRQCVLDAIADIGEWDAGGLHAPTRPAENLPGECSMLLKLTDGKFERVVPEKAGAFECDPDYVAKVTGPVVEQAKLDEDRVSTLFLP